MRRMFATPRLPRRILLAGAGAALVALASIGAIGAGSSDADARIPGDPLVAPPSELAAFANLAETATIVTGGTAKPMPMPSTSEAKTPDVGTLPASPVGRGAAPPAASIDLDRVARSGDDYVVTLADGRRAVLTLDPALQELAEQLLEQARAPRGAIVAMAPDGRILALAGRRTKEPTGSREGTFDWRLAADAWAPAASVFKLVTASALVDAGVDPDGKVCYHGGVRSVLDHNLRDDKRDSRCESLGYGVAHSNNAILGKLAFQNLEPKALEAEARTFGWTDPLPATLALGGTIGALVVPAGRDLEFAKTAAGFSSDAKLSVVGGAIVAATFAGDGEQPMPRIVASIDGNAVASAPSRRVISAKTARTVARMMAETCDSGSAAKSFGRSNTLRVAGKTGTLARTEPFFMEHSWFVGYAPATKPEIIVSVLFGNSESWRLRGHEAARRLIDRMVRPAARDKHRASRRDATRSRS